MKEVSRQVRYIPTEDEMISDGEMTAFQKLEMPIAEILWREVAFNIKVTTELTD